VLTFWRSEPLSEPEQKLLDALFAAHTKAACRENCSTVAVLNSWTGAGSYTAAIASALLTLGGAHAPVAEIMRFLGQKDPEDRALFRLATGDKVPGWGSDFVKGKPDPDWAEVDAALEKVAPGLNESIRAVTTVLHEHGKVIFPNPGAYTAATALALGIPESVAPWLFVQGRLGAWTKILMEASK